MLIYLTIGLWLITFLFISVKNLVTTQSNLKLKFKRFTVYSGVEVWFGIYEKNDSILQKSNPPDIGL